MFLLSIYYFQKSILSEKKDSKYFVGYKNHFIKINLFLVKLPKLKGYIKISEETK